MFAHHVRNYFCLVFALTTMVDINAKVYKKCELARELLVQHEFPKSQIATWVCIAYRESRLNTSAVNEYSGDHGLFQINQNFWCSPPGKGQACGISCTSLEDDDIEDDVACVKRIFRAHKRISGNGFTAWHVYAYYCKDEAKVGEYIKGCFDDDDDDDVKDAKGLKDSVSVTLAAK